MRVCNPNARLVTAWDGSRFVRVLPGQEAEWPDKLAQEAIAAGDVEAVDAKAGKVKAKK